MNLYLYLFLNLNQKKRIPLSIMKKYYLLFFLCLPFAVFSQKKFKKEISFVNDNDLFVSTFRDRYYTNGMFFTYRYLSKNKSKKLEKQISEWQVGHKMYTPFKAVVQHISLHDRPFAAYLYGSFGINRIYKNNTLFKTSIQIGIIGPSAFGKELHDFIHDIYGFQKAIGWKHQIKNAFGLNFKANYSKHLIKDTSNHYDITWINNAKIGTVFTDISTGFYGRIGFNSLQKIQNSISFNTHLNDENSIYNNKVESFIFIKPTVSYTLYDATIQGSFLNTGSDVTKELVPLEFDLEVGILFTVKRFHFGYAVHYHTNKSKNLRYNNGNTYGTIRINYAFN